MLLEIKALTKDFGKLRALDGIDLTVPADQLTGLIGPNGSGKTTLVNLVSGNLMPTCGEMYFAGHNINSWSSARRARSGIARTFQNIELFGQMSVLDNVLMGFFYHDDRSLLGSLIGLPSDRKRKNLLNEQAQELIRFVGLDGCVHEIATNLSYGQQRKVELARALALVPKLLLLDEPAAGMNTKETLELRLLIRRIADRGITILLIEHDMDLLMNVADHVVVFDYGKKLAEGSPEQIQVDQRVVAAYLGQ
jgi:branched-chain amino acid transport system ATP-binding protein